MASFFYPIFFVSTWVFIYLLLKLGIKPDLTLFYSFLLMIFSFSLFESFFTFKKDWRVNSKELSKYFICLFFNSIFYNLGKLLAFRIMMGINIEKSLLTTPLIIILGLIIDDFIHYWFHRLGHVRGFFWNMHVIHHLPKKVNFWSNNAEHFMGLFLSAILKGIPLILLGLSPEHLCFIFSAVMMHNYFNHINSPIGLGPLESMIMTPSHHRLHHSSDHQENGNYGNIFVIWDKIFKTYHRPIKDYPENIGVIDSKYFPSRLFSQYLFPFSALFKRKEEAYFS